MLVLTRKTDESILIGDDIEIKVVQIKGSGPGAQVRLGIVAPKGVTVLRKEVYEAVRAENLRAAREGAERLDPARLAQLFAAGASAGSAPEGGRAPGPAPPDGGVPEAGRQEGREGGDASRPAGP